MEIKVFFVFKIIALVERRKLWKSNRNTLKILYKIKLSRGVGGEACRGSKGMVG
jgi:hypothetical protein